jgi:hypothetical protein
MRITRVDNHISLDCESDGETENAHLVRNETDDDAVELCFTNVAPQPKLERTIELEGLDSDSGSNLC